MAFVVPPVPLALAGIVVNALVCLALVARRGESRRRATAPAPSP